MLDDIRVKPKVSIPFLRLDDLFEHHARIRPDAAALLAPGREPLSYAELYRHIGEVGRVLRTIGIGREDRVAIMLPNGPELALAVFSVAANAACAVVNPVYAADELERYFDVLDSEGADHTGGRRFGGAAGRPGARAQHYRTGDAAQCTGRLVRAQHRQWRQAVARPDRSRQHCALYSDVRHHGAPEDRAADAYQYLLVGL